MMKSRCLCGGLFALCLATGLAAVYALSVPPGLGSAGAAAPRSLLRGSVISGLFPPAAVIDCARLRSRRRYNCAKRWESASTIYDQQLAWLPYQKR